MAIELRTSSFAVASLDQPPLPQGYTMLSLIALALIAQSDAIPPPPEEEPAAPFTAPITETTTTTTTTRVLPVAPPAEPAEPAAPVEAKVKKKRSDDWAEHATFFGGGRTAVAFPPGGKGPAPMAGLELGVAADKGFGYGLHVFGAANTPDAPAFGLPAAPYAFGALVDLRYYLQTVEPLRLYPTLSVGFLAGPAEQTGRNAVLPLINPGFGARVNMGPIYAAIEIGAASFYIPFMAFSVGWEPDRA
jgi:hypothetical protein